MRSSSVSASAHEYKAGSIEIKHPWSRATPKGSEVAGGYMKLINTGTRARPADRRLNADRRKIRDPRDVDGRRRDEDAACCRTASRSSPAETVELKPGSYHLMFVGLKQPFEKGKRVKGTLQFEKAGTVEVEYAVEAVGGSPKGHEQGMDHGGMEHKGH